MEYGSARDHNTDQQKPLTDRYPGYSLPVVGPHSDERVTLNNRVVVRRPRNDVGRCPCVRVRHCR